MKEVEIAYRISKKEFVSYRMRQFFKKRGPIYLLFIIVIAGVTILPDLFIEDQQFSLDDFSLISFLPLIIFPIIMIFAIWFALRKAYNNTKGIDQEMHIKMNDEGYFGKTQIAETSMQWAAIL
ncbi:hypothetical protein LX97_02403 [Nonlabens dokdonensis]|jgi:hypothetical protein|uniref:Uncharacterized protein n=2 Tax=Nonlabens dokdonensis TaxID=328515 RepID=L7W4Y9_NONDD|nr:hypothetical protein [Nonlabens dokdonensis]AGC75222.1 hypothetical protein DDD_0095 [Nonlabens dokdonensis DSW-6]PZX39037.1 hypothetical protein LX97_02403 [Nonlabens dokdonensis]